MGEFSSRIESTFISFSLLHHWDNVHNQTLSSGLINTTMYDVINVNMSYEGHTQVVNVLWTISCFKMMLGCVDYSTKENFFIDLTN